MEVKQETMDNFHVELVKIKEENVFVDSLPTNNVETMYNESKHYRCSPLVPLNKLKVEVDEPEIHEIKSSDYFVNTSDLINIKREAADDAENNIKTELLTEECDMPVFKTDIDFIDKPRRDHLKNRSKKKKQKYRCLVCRKSFKSSTVRKKHVYNHFVNHQVICSCGIFFTHKLEFLIHYFVHITKNKTIQKVNQIHKSKIFQCDICSCQFSSKIQLDSHLLVHNLKLSESEEIKCEICLRLFQHKGDLKRHLRIHTGETPFTCAFCSRTFNHCTTFKYHMVTHNVTPKFQCDICSESFKIKVHYDSHIATHDSSKVYTCDVCSKTFRKKNYLTKHYRTHTGERPFQCTVCFKEFTYSNSLYRHRFTHSETKSFQCNICSAEFTLAVSLKKHTLRTHSTEKFQCEICFKELTTPEGLRMHMMRHNKSFQCEFCSKKFTLPNTLKRHMLTHSLSKMTSSYHKQKRK